jgi:hypothetical protein
MLNGRNFAIIGDGQVLCPLCPQKTDDEGRPVLKDGVAVEIDGSESTFCWKHLKAMVTMIANARRRELPAAMAEQIGNGR